MNATNPKRIENSNKHITYENVSCVFAHTKQTLSFPFSLGAFAVYLESFRCVSIQFVYFNPRKQCIRAAIAAASTTMTEATAAIVPNERNLWLYHGVSVQNGFGFSVSLIFSVWWFKYIYYFYPKRIRDKCMLSMKWLYMVRCWLFCISFCCHFSSSFLLLFRTAFLFSRCSNAMNKGILSSIFWCIIGWQ